MFLALLGAALFATKGIVIKLALADGIDTVTTLTWRMIVSVPIFVMVGIVGYRRKRARTRPPARPGARPQDAAPGARCRLLGYYVASFLDFSALPTSRRSSTG